MSKKRKGRPNNWFFIGLGFFFLLGSIANFQPESSELDITQLEVVLAKEMENVKGSENIADYRFYGENYQARFIILKGSLSGGVGRKLSELQKGQVLKVGISPSDLSVLSYPNNDIVVYTLSHGLTEYLTLSERSSNRNLYRLRWTAMMLFAGLMLLMNGFRPVSTRTNLILVVLFFVGMMLFNELV